MLRQRQRRITALIDQSFEVFHPNPYRQNNRALLARRANGREHELVYVVVQTATAPRSARCPTCRSRGDCAAERAGLLFQISGRRQDASMLAGLVRRTAACATLRVNRAIYVQGDLDWKMHDWFYEAAAAGMVMQGEIADQPGHWRPSGAIFKLKRAWSSLSTPRPDNNLFLVARPESAGTQLRGIRSLTARSQGDIAGSRELSCRVDGWSSC